MLLVTDAWEPQVNGVVRTWEQVTGEMRSRGIQVEIIHSIMHFYEMWN